MHPMDCLGNLVCLLVIYNTVFQQPLTMKTDQLQKKKYLKLIDASKRFGCVLFFSFLLK